MTTSSVINTSPGVRRDSCLESRLLRGIDASERQKILDVAEHRKATANYVLFHRGEQARKLFLLYSGNAKYYRISSQGDERLLHWLVPGDVFGLATFVEDPPAYMGSAQAVGDCEAYCWAHRDVLKLSSAYPQLMQNALRIALEYLSGFAERHKNILDKSAEQRLARVLLNLGHRAGQQYPGGIQVAVTNEHLGGLADVGVFTASRVLQKWERDGAIDKLRGKVIIKSPEKLSQGLDQ